MKVRKDTRHVYFSSRWVATTLLIPILSLIPTTACQQLPPIEPWTPIQAPIQKHTSEFTLRHVFHRGTYQDPNLHVRMDISPDDSVWVSTEDGVTQVEPYPHFTASANPVQIERLIDRRRSTIEEHLSYARLTGQATTLDASHWTLDEVPAPNITDKETILNLATMAANAYVTTSHDTEWENVTQGFNESKSFGWETDGLRGHIFASQDNETIVISLKGTSPAVFDGDGTTTRDKLNDNLFFSCCCAQGGQYFWRQVCDCYSSTYTCNQTCLVKALRRENRYYQAALDLYSNVTEIYPKSNVWIVGHSLGGAVSSLLGLSFGLPVVTFEAPGDDLAAKRLGLPTPPSRDGSRAYRGKYTGSVHVGHTADPVFMGTCNGATATCTLGGYAMESQCHTGLQCVYDTVGDLGWRVGIGNHKIRLTIDQVYKKYATVPECVPDNECVDCFNWKYFESNGSDSTTTTRTSTTTSRRTRTSTCKTPGWWGCLDESTTRTATTSIITTTYTTTTCITPGWFGCKEEANITVTTTTVPETATTAMSSHSASITTSSSGSTTCEHPGWFGCHDPSPSSTTVKSTASKTTSSHTCETPGFIFGCHDKTTTTVATSTITTAPTLTPSQSRSMGTSVPSRTCRHRAFFGLICIEEADATTNMPQHTLDEWNSEL